MTQRPVLPGFHPDPSVCRVGDDVYVVTSSFEYLPGLPVHRSTDLRTWTPVGHGIERPSQMARASTGGGIFAPTLRHHDGLFWIATTDVDRIEDGQLVIHAQDPAVAACDRADPGPVGRETGLREEPRGLRPPVVAVADAT